jgi:hypothetical protein
MLSHLGRYLVPDMRLRHVRQPVTRTPNTNTPLRVFVIDEKSFIKQAYPPQHLRFHKQGAPIEKAHIARFTPELSGISLIQPVHARLPMAPIHMASGRPDRLRLLVVVDRRCDNADSGIAFGRGYEKIEEIGGKIGVIVQ